MLPLISRSGGRIRGVSGAALAGLLAWTGRDPGVPAPLVFAAGAGRSFALAMGFLWGCDDARAKASKLASPLPSGGIIASLEILRRYPPSNARPCLRRVCR